MDTQGIKTRIEETIYPNNVGAIKAVNHQQLLKEIVDYVDGGLQKKVDAESGKGLSTNDFTDAYKSKVDAAKPTYVCPFIFDELVEGVGIMGADAPMTESMSKQLELSEKVQSNARILMRVGIGDNYQGYVEATQQRNINGAVFLQFVGAGSLYTLESNSIGKVLTKSVQAIEGGVKADGAYPDLIAGDLVGRGESVPAEITFRASGGKSIKDGRAYIKRIKGDSVVYNQFVNEKVCEFTLGQGITGGLVDGKIVLNGKAVGDTYIRIVPYGSFVYRANHKYALIKEGSEVAGAEIKDVNAFLFENTIGSVSSDIDSNISVVVYDGVTLTDYQINSIRVIDLTKMYGAGNEPTTIEEYEARKPIVADEYAYNEGEVIHCNTESIKSVGDNAWDEEWEVGGLSEVTGQEYDTTTNFRSKNYIKILPNTQYYFKKPAGVFLLPYYYDEDKNFIAADDVMFTGQNGNAFTTLNAAYMRFIVNQGNYGNDIMLTLVHSGWKQDTDAGYQPYWQDTLPLPIIRKYFPQGMKSAGSAHDEIRYNKASGKWEAVQRIIGVRVADHVNRDANGVFILKNLPSKPINDISGTYSKNVLMAGFTPDLGAYSYVLLPESRTAVVSDTIWLNGQQLEQYSTAQEYIDALGDTQLYYELAEPIVTEITEDFRDYYNVADFGTEQMLAELPSAPFSADIIYQFNAVDMIREHEMEITELQKVIATMQAQLASLANS